MGTENTALSVTSDLREKLTERIRGSFVDLIPEEQWQALIDTEIKKFINPPPDNNYRRTAGYSDLQKEVNAAMTVLFKERLCEVLQNEGWVGSIAPNGQLTASTMVSKIVKENMETIAAAFFGNMIQNVVANVLLQLREQAR